MGTPAPNEPSAGISTWDASPVPYRPGLPDFNGAALTNRADAPPNPATFPTANLLNGTALMEVGIGQVVPNAVLSVTFVGGNPTINAGVAIAGFSPGATSPITNGALTIERTPSGSYNGDVFIYWPANTFPAPVRRPMASLNGTTAALAPAADWYTDVGTGNSGVRIVCRSYSNSVADLPFSVSIP